MLMFIGLEVVCYMFYTSAKRVKRSTIFWVFTGIVMWFILGAFFLFISEKYILNITTLSEAMSLRWWKFLLEGVSAVIIIIISYFVIEQFVVPKKRIN